MTTTPAPATAPIPGDYGKMSDRRLADEFGNVKTQVKAETKRLERITAELVRRGKIHYVGQSFTVLKVEGGQNRLDTDAVKIEMGAAWYERHKVWSPSVTWVATARPLPEFPPVEPLRPGKAKPKPDSE